MTKFAAAIGIGPKFCNPFGYDIVFFGDYAEFAMEKCETNFGVLQKQAENPNISQMDENEG